MSRRGRAANMWVRPTQKMSNQASSTQDPGDSSNLDTRAVTTSVILKGPRHYPGAKFHHTWKRPREKPETIESDETEAIVSERVQKDGVSEQGTAKPDDCTTSLIRRGKNKLVSKKSKESAVAQGIEQHETVNMGERDSSNTLPMVKVGEHKLVLTKKEDDSSPQQGNEVVHERRGHAKLVIIQGEKKRGRIESSRGRPKSGAGAKRIKLNPDETGDVVAKVSTQSAGEIYTEFAYRQTVSQRGRGRGRGRGDVAAKSNMGLVRVEPDAATTPICTTYLGGMPCTNPRCKKRHDVPKEAATPICSFFQRHGQCKKRDTCPFRHIKVNPHATVCPSFSLLGFCEDKECIMKHIRVAKSNLGV